MFKENPQGGAGLPSQGADRVCALGQRVIAKMATGVCDVGERGVVYEVYSREWGGRSVARGSNGHGVSVIFESGRYDGFSPDEQRAMLVPLAEVDDFASLYVFRNVGQLVADYRAGRFRFAPVIVTP